MKWDFEWIVFFITIGMLLATIFIVIVIEIGREYERIDKKRSRQSSDSRCDDNSVHSYMGDNDNNSDVGNIHR